MNLFSSRLALAASLALAMSVSVDAARKPRPVEPIPIPADIEQGVGMIFVDPSLAPVRAVEVASRGNSPEERALVPLDELMPMNPIYSALRRGLVRYQARYGRLPAVYVEPGSALKRGSSGPRVAALRKRLGLSAGAAFDLPLDRAVRDFQRVHGIESDGIAAGRTIAALNTPVRDWVLRLVANIERAKRLPDPARFPRYVLVDAAAAKLYMVENGVIRDSMKVVVGAPESPTPMMAATISHISLNPYWNVPADLAQTLIAPRVVKEGVSYLTTRHYAVFSDWTEDAVRLDPKRVDWSRVASGRQQIRLRRDPSPGNSMGDMKFNLPNDYGIYLHDTPDKAKLKPEYRQISNGCVRLEDARRFARWLMDGPIDTAGTRPEQRVDLPRGVPIYMTYLTASAGSSGVQFRGDPYHRDRGVIYTYTRQRVPIGAW